MPRPMLTKRESKVTGGSRNESVLGRVLWAAALAVGLLVPHTSHAHTVNICWLVKPNGDVKFYSGTYHTPDGNLSGGLTIDGTRYDFTDVFTGSIDTVGVTNCQAGFDMGGSVVADPCSSGLTIAQWQTVVVSGLTDNTYSLSVTADSSVETPYSGCYPSSSFINVTDPCNAFGDDDNDFICNPSDQCDSDPNKGVPGACGCGVADTDSDSDGTADCIDGCPSDPGKTAAGVCGCGVVDTGTDTDMDGTQDCVDACPNDGNKIAAGVCGCGVSDADSDGDSVPDCNDLCLGDDATGDSDHDGLCTDHDHRALVIASDFSGSGGPCTEGGSILEVGVDENGDSALDSSEVSHTSYVCNGITGTDGLTSLVATSAIAPGETCPTGGFEIRYGIDDDVSGTLSELEQDGSHVVCSGLNSAVRVTALAVGDSSCPAGGVSVSSGTDDDGNGMLDEAEVDLTDNACNGETSLTATTSLESGSAQCPAGGTQFDVGIDADRDGTLDAEEVTASEVICNGAKGAKGATGVKGANGTDGTDGADGKGAAVRISGLPDDDERCPAGGSMVETGVDANGNGSLDDEEVQSSEVLCEPAGLLFDTATLAEDPDTCAHGGQRVRIGHDDGTPGGIAGDGELQDEEVESTRDVCLAATDVLVSGGHSSCAVAPARRGSAFVLWCGLVLAFGTALRRRRRLGQPAEKR